MAEREKKEYTQRQVDVMLESERETRREIVRRNEALERKLANFENPETMLPVSDHWPEPKWPGHAQRKPERLLLSLGYGVGRLVSFLRWAPTGKDRGGAPWTPWGGPYRHNQLGTHYREELQYVPRGAGKAINHLCETIDAYGLASYRAGLEDGRNLLAQLSSGHLTKPDFEKKVARMNKEGG